MASDGSELIAWGLLACLITLATAVYMAYIYPTRDCPFIVRVACVWCWWCSFSIIYLLPIDLSETAKGGNFLFQVWSFMYWTSFILAWTIIPIAWYYFEAGDFTPINKLRTAIVGNIRFYVISAVLLVAFLIYVAVSSHMTGSALLGFAICLSNTWGLTLYVLLLGYGLVEVPRSIWYEASLSKALEYCYYEAAMSHDATERAADDLVTTKGIMDNISRSLQGSYAYRNQFNAIEDQFKALENVDLKMDGKLSDFSETALYEEIKEAKEPDLALLKKLNAHCRSSIRKYFRFRDKLQDIAQKGTMLQSLVARQGQPLDSLCKGGLTQLPQNVYLRWMLRWREPIFKLISIVLACASIITIWSQLTINKNARFLSPFAQMYVSAQSSDINTQLATLLPLLYLCSCAFSSMFRLQLFDYYYMDTNRRTGVVPLLFNGTYLLRIFASIGANFTAIIHANDTSFQKVMGGMSVVPFFGDAFNTYLPILISIFSICCVLNVYARILKFLGIETFTYFDANDADKLAEGKAQVDAYATELNNEAGDDERDLGDEAADTFL